jgi:ElaB/YqjD/DUF883 family membrane-anchored ribosome-binding protein
MRNYKQGNKFMKRFETSEMLSSDSPALEAARSLLEATAEVTDKKVAAARQRLNQALESGQDAFTRLQYKAIEGTRAADRAVHDHPYPTILTAFGLGALVALLLCRRI